MFEVGFSELLLVALIGLLVLGPERLPTAVRTTSIVLGRLRRQFNDIRAEVEREIGADEIRAQLHNEGVMEEIARSRKALEDTRRELMDPGANAGDPPAAQNAPVSSADPARTQNPPGA